MADVLRNINDRVAILWSQSRCNQLVKHRIFVCICGCLPVRRHALLPFNIRFIWVSDLDRLINSSNRLTLWILHRGPRPSIIISSVLILVGNWIKYGGTRANNFGVVVFAQVVIGVAQPFILAAPTRYSDMWFTERGRVSATAVASLANAFGGAVGCTSTTTL